MYVWNCVFVVSMLFMCTIKKFAVAKQKSRRAVGKVCVDIDRGQQTD